ncbi:ATPase [Robbsia sp. Bb-Pol-6]|uniref:ATPase n=1 Tax=Robbsia betulipollinis TaxID=2981849 RepID=A0ABT3ZLM7_9BURK|nr:ATPase [Robbsia betulipollinis]MCY0387443.1 ATPase [Robbsia betulipollinis]
MRTPLIMLNDLESLSANINRLLHSVEAGKGALADREAQLARVRGERDEAMTAALALRAERDRLRDERDALLAKIEDAQVKLNAILEKLPVPRAMEHGEPARQGEFDPRDDPHAHVRQAEGETYER